MFVRTPFAGLLALALLLSPNTASAQEGSAAEKIKKLAEDIAKTLKENMQTAIVIGEITGPAAPTTASGPGVQASLIAELQKLSITVDESAFFGLKGEYFPVEDEGKKEQLIVRIELTIRNNKTGKSFGTISQTLDYKANTDLVKLLAPTVTLPARASPETQNELIKVAVNNPAPPAPEGNVSKVTPKSQFGVEVLTRGADGKFAPVKPSVNKNKQLVVELESGCEYTLRLINNSPHEAAANVTIDGLDVFQFFKPLARKPKNYILGAGTSSIVEGWMFGFNTKKDEANYKRFLVTDFANSAAAKELTKGKDTAAYAALKSSAKVGTITVCFHPSWEGAPPSEYKGTRSVEDKATGFGQEIKSATTQVKRTIGPLLEVITIRYKK
jgi:dihydroneopterin aldolase